MSAEVVAYQVWVRGRVQGVGFRFYVRDWAEALGVSGYVRNLPDGRVEAFLQGREALVEELLSRIRKGPPGARVEGVLVERVPPAPMQGGFSIRSW